MARVPPLSVPPQLRDAVEAVRTLSKDSYAEVEAWVGELDPRISASALRRQSPVAGVSGEVLTSLLDLAAAIHSLARIFHASVNDIVQSLAAQTDDAGESANLVQRLTELAVSRPVVLRSDARSLDSEHPNRFRAARVLSDIRPRFERGDVSSPREAIIGHTLKLEYAANEPQTIYIALSRGDLVDLQEAVGRALEKDAALGDVLKQAGLTDLTPVDDE